jgi:hypothetical protein
VAVAEPAWRWNFERPVSFSEPCPGERIYPFPPGLFLNPLTEYKISGWIRDQGKSIRLFEFNFQTNDRGRPSAF